MNNIAERNGDVAASERRTEWNVHRCGSSNSLTSRHVVPVQQHKRLPWRAQQGFRGDGGEKRAGSIDVRRKMQSRSAARPRRNGALQRVELEPKLKELLLAKRYAVDLGRAQHGVSLRLP